MRTLLALICSTRALTALKRPMPNFHVLFVGLLVRTSTWKQQGAAKKTHAIMEDMLRPWCFPPVSKN